MIAVVGLGFVGTSISALLSKNHKVLGIDSDPKKVEVLGSGKATVPDKGIEDHLRNYDLNLSTEVVESVDYVVKRLNFLENEFEKGWSAEVDNAKNLIFSRLIRDVNERFIINSDDINSLKYDGIDKMASFLQDVFLTSPELKWNDEVFKFSGPTELAEKMINIGKKGLIFQRYKGLGEMNPDQLWETTLDPQYRSLLRVSVEQAQDASDVFSDLMGDDVEKRKEFIQNNAKKVSNLDV